MDILIEKQQLVRKLSLVIGAVNPKNTLPILGNVLVETVGADAIQLTATDLEIGISTKCEARISKEGAVTIPARKFYDVLRELPEGDIHITVAKNYAVNISTGKSYCKVMGLGREDFPRFPDLKVGESIEIEQKIVRECFTLTSFAISHDETRYVLNGVLVRGEGSSIKFVATDGRRLAFIEKDLGRTLQNTFEFILPTKAVHELGKILESEGFVKIAQLQNQVLFNLGDTFVISRLIEGKFPNYEQVIPKEEKTVGASNREQLLSAIKRASLFTTQEAQAVKFDFVNDKILVSSHAPNLGEVKEEIEAEVKGDSISIGFNPQYLMDALKILEVDKVSISLSQPDKPGLVRGRDGYVYVVMPMQIA